MNGILIVAHEPLASAMRSCALHVFSDCGNDMYALDVPPNENPEDSFSRIQAGLDVLGERPVLVMTDLMGATPCNVAKRLIDPSAYVSTTHQPVQLVCGLNVSMLLRALTYRHESLPMMAQRAMVGGKQGVQQMEPESISSTEH